MLSENFRVCIVFLVLVSFSAKPHSHTTLKIKDNQGWFVFIPSEKLQVSVVPPVAPEPQRVRSRPDNTERDTIPLLSSQSPFITVITEHSP